MLNNSYELLTLLGVVAFSLLFICAIKSIK